VYSREALQGATVDVEFMNKTFHRNFSIPNEYNYTMAALGYTGLILASKGKEVNLDKYEDDEEEEE